MDGDETKTTDTTESTIISDQPQSGDGTGAGPTPSTGPKVVAFAGGARKADKARKHSKKEKASKDDKRGSSPERTALEIWARIWRSFAKNRRTKSASAAWSQWQQDIADNAMYLSVIVNGREFSAMVSDVEERIKNESASSKTDPKEAMASWLRGEDDLGFMGKKEKVQ